MTDDKRPSNYDVQQLMRYIQDLTYTELSDFARQVIAENAVSVGEDVPDVEAIEASRVDAMARALLQGSRNLNENYNS